MKSWKAYLDNQKSYCISVEEASPRDLHFVVVIPSFKEPELIRTIESLHGCHVPEKAVEVIVVINSPENSPAAILSQNEKTVHELRDWEKVNPFSFFKLRVLVANNLPGKDAGAGLARKIGMDEAVRRFERAGNYEGVIISLDADTTVDPNYLVEIEKFFEIYQADGCNIFFEHPLEGTENSPELYEGIAQYELFLRYFVQSLREIHYPFAFHTIGSGFASKADAYVRQGGMNKRTAGEDFYFLQKLIPHGRFYELNSTSVYPSPRVSDRVPFGTGAAMKELAETNQRDFFAYHSGAFGEIDRFMKLTDFFYDNEKIDLEAIIRDACMRKYLVQNGFTDKLLEIRQNSKGLKSFRKRFFNWFNAFRVFKFLNYAHETCYDKIPVKDAALSLLKAIDRNVDGLTGSKEVLLIFREMQRKTQWEVNF
jgi:hypothetical protein